MIIIKKFQIGGGGQFRKISFERRLRPKRRAPTWIATRVKRSFTGKTETTSAEAKDSRLKERNPSRCHGKKNRFRVKTPLRGKEDQILKKKVK